MPLLACPKFVLISWRKRVYVSAQTIDCHEMTMRLRRVACKVMIVFIV